MKKNKMYIYLGFAVIEGKIVEKSKKLRNCKALTFHKGS